jgi:hypothetical protein
LSEAGVAAHANDASERSDTAMSMTFMAVPFFRPAAFVPDI